MDNWENEWHAPRPIGIGSDRYKEWTVEPGAVSGSGAATEYGDYIDLEEPLSSGLHALPGMSLETDGGGELAAAVEFWDANEKIGEADLASLSAVETRVPLAATDYALPSMRATVSSADATGVFYSAWETYAFTACAVALLIIESADCDGMAFSSSVALEFGDAGGSVLKSIPICSGSGGANCSITPSVDMASVISMPTVAKVRVKLTVSSASGGGWPSGSVVGRIRRFE